MLPASPQANFLNHLKLTDMASQTVFFRFTLSCPNY